MLNDKEHNISNNPSDSETSGLDGARDDLENLQDKSDSIQDGLEDLKKILKDIEKRLVDDEISKQKIRISAYNEALPLIDKNDYKAACNVLLDAIKPQNSQEMFSWAAMLFNGTEVEKDIYEATLWLKKAADLGHANAQFYFACYLYMGKYVSEDIPLAMEYFKNSANNGNEYSQKALDAISKSDEKININFT